MKMESVSLKTLALFSPPAAGLINYSALDEALSLTGDKNNSLIAPELLKAHCPAMFCEPPYSPEPLWNLPRFHAPSLLPHPWLPKSGLVQFFASSVGKSSLLEPLVDSKAPESFSGFPNFQAKLKRLCKDYERLLVRYNELVGVLFEIQLQLARQKPLRSLFIRNKCHLPEYLQSMKQRFQQIKKESALSLTEVIYEARKLELVSIGAQVMNLVLT